jgi:hypothetical protein
MVAVWVIDAAEDTQWRELRHPDQPTWLSVRLRLAPTRDGVAVAGVQVERRDGHAVTARDLRLVKFPPNWVLFGEAASRWYAPDDTAPAIITARKGARGHDDEHWAAVWAAWLRAREVAPRAPVKWLLASGRWPVTDATMRRWVARAQERAAELGWDMQAQQTHGFLRQDREPPAEMESLGGGDSG